MDERSMLTNLYETTEIPMCLAGADSDSFYAFPFSEKPYLPKHLIQYCIEDFVLQKRDGEHPLVLLMEPAYFIGVAALSENKYLILGPTSPYPLSQEQILNFSVNLIDSERLAEFCKLLVNTPAVTYRKFISALSVAVQLFTGKVVSSEKILLCNNTAQKKETEAAMMEMLFVQRENSISHSSQSYELGILAAIEEGNLPLLKRRIMEPVTGRIGQMSQDMLTQEKYTFVSFITLVTRTAIKGGVSPESAYSLSDIYCRRMDSMTRVQDISALAYQMAFDFCAMVADVESKGKYSVIVQELCNYITAHLHEDKISLKELADTVGMCTRSISIKFREETGLSITDYIHKQRMLEAAHLLAHSNYTISDICTFLQYSSQSYFSKIFKESYSTTPQKYREKSIGSGRVDF